MNNSATCDAILYAKSWRVKLNKRQMSHDFNNLACKIMSSCYFCRAPTLVIVFQCF